MELSASALSVGSFFTDSNSSDVPTKNCLTNVLLTKEGSGQNWCLHHLEDTKMFKCPSDYQMQGTRISHKHLSLKVQGDYQMQRNSHSTQTLVTLKVQGCPLHYIVDHQGTFQSPKLFDTLIGTKQ